VRETTERPEAVTAGTAKLVGTEPAKIVAAATQLLSNPAAYQMMATAINPFGMVVRQSEFSKSWRITYLSGGGTPLA